ncbi:hypothetical protein [Streptomyces collinus]|uniref:hypothetical protein n=1 Tax=Streptomyces collinus TaxID=42684 RepID=UPI0036333E64
MHRALLTPLLAISVTGCALPGQDTPCTKTGATSQVSTMWRPADFGGRDEAQVRLCVDESCEERSSGTPDDPFASLSVRLPEDIGAFTVTVRLVVTSTKSGDTVVEDSTRVRLKEQHPNGTACPPTAWTATFRAHPDRGLISPKGMKLQ